MCSGLLKEEGLRVKATRRLAKLPKPSWLSQVAGYLGSRFTLKQHRGKSRRTKREIERRHKVFDDTRPHDDMDDLIRALEFENFMRDDYVKEGSR
mgnify:CR=1 FL=1|jgi:hypothetical protein